MFIRLHKHSSGSYAVEADLLDIPGFSDDVSELFKEYGLSFCRVSKKFPNLKNIWTTSKWEYIPFLMEDLHNLYREEIPNQIKTEIASIRQTKRTRKKLDCGLIKSQPKGQFQIDGIKEGIQTNRLMLAWEMGLGKSFTVISIVNHLVKYSELDRILVLCPIESMINFKREMIRFNSFGLTEDDFYLVTTTERDPFSSDKKVVICTYRRFLMIGEDFYKKKRKTNVAPSRIMKPVLDIDKWGTNRCIILDESHLVKNKSAKQTKMVRVHIEFFEYRYELTGTPAPKGVEDFYSQLDILDKTIIGRPYYSFLRSIAKLGDSYSDYNLTEYIPEKVKEFEDYASPWVSRKLSKGNLNLPPLFEKPVYCGLNGKQKEIYQEIVQNSFVSSKEKDGQILTKTVKNKFPYVLQAIDNPLMLKGKISKELSSYLFNLVNRFKFEENSKIEVLESLLRKHTERGEKIIIWSGHPATLDSLQERYGKKYGLISMHGETKTEGLKKEDFREKWLDNFRNNPSAKVIGLSYYVFSSAINLVESNVSIYIDHPTDFKYYGQSKKRNHRIGQNKKVFVYNLIIENSLDQLNYNSLLNEKGLRNEVLFNSGIVLSKEEWKRVFTGSFDLKNTGGRDE